MKIALVHEWLQGRAGSEKVFEELASLFPDAHLYALSRNPEVAFEFGGRSVQTTCLNHRWLRERRNITFPLMPIAWRLVGNRTYDAVISSHHAFAHVNRLAEGRIHLCYVHSPARYLWTPEIDSRGSNAFFGPARIMLRGIDRGAASRVASYAANSRAVAARVEKYWGRHAKVIPPPVNVEYFRPTSTTRNQREYLLGVSRWVPYKGLHRIIQAGEAAGLPVKIAGSGPEKDRLLGQAAKSAVPVEIIEAPTDYQLRSLYHNALALVYPAIEDFGLVPVEAQAAGIPVIGPAAGGLLDTVVHGKTGFLTPSADPQELAAAVASIGSLQSEDCIRNAERFSFGAFEANIAEWVSPFGIPVSLPKG